MAVSRRGWVFASVCLLAYLANFGRFAFAPLVRPFMDIFEVGAGAAGLIATTVWLGSALSRLPTGVLLTRVERHHALLGMAGLMAVGAAATAAAPGIALLAVGAFVVGLASGMYYVSANPFVSELYPDRVGWAVGLSGTVAQVAAVSAPVAVGLALSRGEWWYVFVGLSLVAVTAIGLFTLTTRGADLPSAGAEDRDLVSAAREQWRLILTGIAMMGFVGFVWQGAFNFFDTYVTTVKGFSSGTARGLLTALFAAGVPSFYFAGRLADRFRTVPLLFAILGLFATFLFGLTVAEGLVAVALVTLVLGVLIHSIFPVLDSFMLSTLPDDNRASAYAVYSASMMLLQAPGSAVLGALVDAGVSFGTMFRVYAVGVFGLLALLVVLYRDGRFPNGA